MKYQLQTGKTINISLEQFLTMTDLDLEALIAADSGSYVDDPFSDLDATEHKDKSKIESEIPQVEEIPEEEIEQIKKELEDGD